MTDNKDKRVNLVREIKALQNDVEQIRSATDWAQNYLKHGSGCDSSSRSEVRMSYVREAIRDFLDEHRREVLELAAQKVEAELAELKQCLEQHSN